MGDTPTDRFWSAFTEGTAEHPLVRHFRIWQNQIVLEVHIWQGTVRLAGIQSLYPKQGNASRCLKWLLKLAKDHGLSITGTINKYGTNRQYLNTRQLRAWYKRHGAKQDRHGNFIFN
jgi:hypothetical protein